MFQLEILEKSLLEKMGRYEKGAGDDVSVYTMYCRIVVGRVPIRVPAVWVYGAGRSSVKASLSYVFVDYNLERMSYEGIVRLREAHARQEGHYVLEVPRGVEIVTGMLISDVPPDAEPGQAGE